MARIDDAALPRHAIIVTGPDKRALRATLRQRRREAAASAFSHPQPSPAFLLRLHPGAVIATYHPIGGEADPAALAEAALAAGARLALPHVVSREAPLRFLLVDGDEPLAAGPFGLRNPHPHWREAMPAVVMTPLVGFDRRGNRLGQGAGHYDRAFAVLPGAWRVGVAWSVQEVGRLPQDVWDLPLHAVATEREWIECR